MVGGWEVGGVQLFCSLLQQVEGGGCPNFLFKSLDNNMVYTLVIDVYVYKRNRSTTKVLWVLKF